LRRVLPPARRARGLWPAARPGRSDRASAAALEADGARRRRSGRRPGGGVHGRSRMTEALDGYYGRPIVKEPVWQAEIPFYLFTGGVAGASSVLHGVARLAGNERLAKSALYVGAAADAVSPLLLVSDLGRPERFLNLFRVFKVTSPLNVGSWVLGVSGGGSTPPPLLGL